MRTAGRSTAGRSAAGRSTAGRGSAGRGSAGSKTNAPAGKRQKKAGRKPRNSNDGRTGGNRLNHQEMDKF